MSATDRFYSLILCAYPADFRREHGEEILGTLAESREAGEPRRHVPQVLSLLYDGGRQRWLYNTNGEFWPTVRQGLAWGVLVLVARQAGLAIADLVQPFSHHWQEPFSLTRLLLVVGWLLAFCLLAAGRRRWGLIALSVALGGFIFASVRLALSYGGPFSWPFTLHFFLPATLPLLAAYCWPSSGVRLPAWSWPPILALAAALPPISMMSMDSNRFGFNIWGWSLVLLVILVALVILITSLRDPRWAVAATVVVAVFGGKSLVTITTGSNSLENLLQILVIWVFIPGAAVLLARRARRSAPA